MAQEGELYREVLANITQQLPYTPWSRLTCSLVHRVRPAAGLRACKGAAQMHALNLINCLQSCCRCCMQDVHARPATAREGNSHSEGLHEFEI